MHQFSYYKDQACDQKVHFDKFLFYRVFKRSRIYRKLRRGWRPFKNAIVIGDQAYEVISSINEAVCLQS